jgi:hypothetical protein
MSNYKAFMKEIKVMYPGWDGKRQYAPADLQASHTNMLKSQCVKVVLKGYRIRRAWASARTLCPFPEYSPLFQNTILIVSKDPDSYCSVSKGPDDYRMVSGCRDKYRILSGWRPDIGRKYIG